MIQQRPSSSDRANIVRCLFGCCLAAAIAWLAPFDTAFSAATLGSPVLRSVLIVVLALAGLWSARRLGLGIEPRRLDHTILTPLVLAVGMAGYCFLVDLLLRSQLPQLYIHTMSTVPTVERIFVFATRAFNENVIYRLFFGSILTYLIGQAWKNAAGGPALGAYFAGFTLSQIVNIWINVSSFAAITPMHLLHDALRYVIPGLVWSWVYCRHGFQSNEISCMSVNIFLQPLLTIGLH